MSLLWCLLSNGVFKCSKSLMCHVLTEKCFFSCSIWNWFLKTRPLHFSPLWGISWLLSFSHITLPYLLNGSHRLFSLSSAEHFDAHGMIFVYPGFIITHWRVLSSIFTESPILSRAPLCLLCPDNIILLCCALLSGWLWISAAASLYIASFLCWDFLPIPWLNFSAWYA